jgi:hypothetical protein
MFKGCRLLFVRSVKFIRASGPGRSPAAGGLLFISVGGTVRGGQRGFQTDEMRLGFGFQVTLIFVVSLCRNLPGLSCATKMRWYRQSTLMDCNVMNQYRAAADAWLFVLKCPSCSSAIKHWNWRRNLIALGNELVGYVTLV